MKICPSCRRAYPDDNLNFCLDDGEMLNFYPSGLQDERVRSPLSDFQDSPPTLVIDPSRTTNPIGWSSDQPIKPYAAPRQTNAQALNYGAPFSPARPNQTLPTVALVLGIASVLFTCCYGGFWLGGPAAVLGIIGMRNVKADPANYGGRGMAIAGLVLGAATFTISILMVIAFAIRGAG